MSSKAAFRGFFVVCALSLAALSSGCQKAAPSSGAAPAGAAADGGSKAPKATSRSLEVTASFDMEMRSADAGEKAARDLTELTQANGGFVQEREVGDGSRRGRMVLRIPASQLDAVRSILAANGPVAHEQIQSRDVTDAIADVDARAKNATLEEARIQKILDERTGSLADVLAAEKALGEVRENIERLQAEQRVAHGRVDLATVTVSFEYPLADSEVPVFHRAIVAAGEGVTLAKNVSVGALMLALRSGPSLLILGGFAYLCVRALKKLRAKNIKIQASPR